MHFRLLYPHSNFVCDLVLVIWSFTYPQQRGTSVPPLNIDFRAPLPGAPSSPPCSGSCAGACATRRQRDDLVTPTLDAPSSRPFHCHFQPRCHDERLARFVHPGLLLQRAARVVPGSDGERYTAQGLTCNHPAAARVPLARASPAQSR